MLLPLGVSVSAQQPSERHFRSDLYPPEGFRVNRTSYSSVMEVLRPTRPAVTQEHALKKLQLEDIWSALGEYRVNYVRGFKGTQPGERLVGRALTMRFLPPRPDPVRAIGRWAEEGDRDRRYYARAAEEARPGDLVVAELGGENGHILFDGMGALGIKLRGAAGVVIDGGSRALSELQAEEFKDFPVFARFFGVHTSSWLGAERNTPVRIAAVTVLPGLVPTVLETAATREALEDHEWELLQPRMHRFRDVYRCLPSSGSSMSSLQGVPTEMRAETLFPIAFNSS